MADISSLTLDAFKYVALIMLPVPLIHLWLHALLPWWRRYPRAYGAWFFFLCVASWSIGFLILPHDIIILAPCWWTVIMGFLLAVFGAILVAWSFVVLGPRRFLTFEAVMPTKKYPSIEIGGPFRFFPHPAYLGYLAVLGGIVFMTGSVFVIGVFAYSISLFPFIMYLEENELQNRYARRDV